MNSSRIITREAIENYLYCPLFYRYKNELEFSYLENNSNKMFIECAKHAVSAYFDFIARGLSKYKARNKMGGRLHMIWRNMGHNLEDFPLAHSTIMQILLEFDNVFRESRDLVIGGGLTATIPLLGWGIQDTIDGIYIEKGRKTELSKSKRPIVGVQIASDMAVSQNMSVHNLRHPIVKYALNVGSTNTFGSGHPPKLLVIHIPSMKRRSYELVHGNYKEAIWLMSSVLRAIDAKVYPPIVSENKCRSCWYRHECSNYFSTPNLIEKKLGSARRSCLDRVEALDYP